MSNIEKAFSAAFCFTVEESRPVFVILRLSNGMRRRQHGATLVKNELKYILNNHNLNCVRACVVDVEIDRTKTQTLETLKNRLRAAGRERKREREKVRRGSAAG